MKTARVFLAFALPLIAACNFISNNPDYDTDIVPVKTALGTLEFRNAETGESIAAGQFAEATLFSGGLALVACETGPVEAIDKTGKVLFQLPQADVAWRFSDGYAVFADYNGSVGVIDATGKVTIPPGKYAKAASEGVRRGTVSLAVLDSGKLRWGVVDVNGNEIIPFGYANPLVHASRKGRYVVTTDTSKVVINSKNEFVGPWEPDTPNTPDSTAAFLLMPDPAAFSVVHDRRIDQTRMAASVEAAVNTLLATADSTGAISYEGLLKEYGKDLRDNYAWITLRRANDHRVLQISTMARLNGVHSRRGKDFNISQFRVRVNPIGPHATEAIDSVAAILEARYSAKKGRIILPGQADCTASLKKEDSPLKEINLYIKPRKVVDVQ